MARPSPALLRSAALAALMVLTALAAGPAAAQAPERRVLAFHKWNGPAHSATDTCLARLKAHLAARGVLLDQTRDSLALSPTNLARYGVLLFMNTNYRGGRILDRAQEEAVEAYVHGGGGFIGIHSAAPLAGAAELEAIWPWYVRLWGTRFIGHPNAEEADAVFEDSTHPSTRGLPGRITVKDEWYLLRDDPRAIAGVTVHARVDAATLAAGGKDRAVTWSRTFEGGRAWFTTMGHDLGTFGHGGFLDHLAGGIAWAGGWDGGTAVTPRRGPSLKPLRGPGGTGLLILFPDGDGWRNLSGRRTFTDPRSAR